jgi:hypothetical protein
MEGFDANAAVNKDAVKADAKDAKDAKTLKPMDGINLGKTLTVADITGTLKNNPGVQKMIDKPSSE